MLSFSFFFLLFCITDGSCFSLQGCYEDNAWSRDLPTEVTVSNLIPELCVAECRNRGFKYAGAQVKFITVTSEKRYNVTNHRQLHCLFSNLFGLTIKKTPKLWIADHCQPTAGDCWGLLCRKHSHAMKSSFIIQSKRLAGPDVLKYIFDRFGKSGHWMVSSAISKRSFDDLFDVRLNKRLNKQWSWFVTLMWQASLNKTYISVTHYSILICWHYCLRRAFYKCVKYSYAHCSIVLNDVRNPTDLRHRRLSSWQPHVPPVITKLASRQVPGFSGLFYSS